MQKTLAVSYTHLRAHETGAYLVCRLLLEKKKQRTNNERPQNHRKKGPQMTKWKPDLVENGFKNGGKKSKMDQKWSQEEQKLEADRARWPKIAPDSAKEPPRRPNQGYGGKPGLQNGGQNLPKSVKKVVKNSVVFLITFRIDFSSIFDRKVDEKLRKKRSKKDEKNK